MTGSVTDPTAGLNRAQRRAAGNVRRRIDMAAVTRVLELAKSGVLTGDTARLEELLKGHQRREAQLAARRKRARAARRRNRS